MTPKFLWFLLAIFLFALSQLAIAKNSSSFPIRLLISYTYHPQVELEYKPLIEKVYDELGIEITFVETTVKRGEYAMRKALVDGDVVYTEQTLPLVQDALKVDVPIGKFQLVLLCNLGMNCNQSALFEHNCIVINNADLVFYEAFFDQNAADYYPIATYRNMLELMRLKRFNYAVYPLSGEEINGDYFKGEFERFVLAEDYLFHVLHKKHAALIPHVEATLKKVLAESE